MLWFRRKSAALLLAGFLLSGCGFHPLYALQTDGDSVSAQIRNIEVASIPDREGQELRNALIDRLYKEGRPAEAPLLLNIGRLKIIRTELGIRKDATATRGETEIQAQMSLVERATGTVLLTREIRASGDYNRLDNQYATLVSERFSTDRVLEDIADIVTTELALYFSRAAQSPSPGASP